jgi:hypothetical protein
VSILLGPDPQRLTHPRATLLEEHRSLAELRGDAGPALVLKPGTLIRWQR